MTVRSFALSWQIAKSEFILRNEGSYLGILWYLLNPLLLFGLLALIFYDRVGNNIESYLGYLFIGIILFNFFQNVTRQSSDILSSNRRLLRSINFPRESLIISSVLLFLFSHIIEFVLLVVILGLTGSLTFAVLGYIPILLLFTLFIQGLSYAISIISVYVGDFTHVWSFFLRLLWLATPIFYDIGGQNKLFIANLFNPLYYFITVTRDIVLYQTIPQFYLLSGVIFFSVITYFIGKWVFLKFQYRVVEVV